MKKSKLTMDINEVNRSVLEKIKQTTGSSYGSTINTLIETFCVLPSSATSFLLEMIMAKAIELNEEIKDTEEGFTKASKKNERDALLKIGKFMNEGNDISLELKPDESYKKVKLKNGHLFCPSSWIVLNPEDTHLSYAGVIEIKNSSQYNMPHFLFLSDRQYASEYDTEYINEIDELCINQCPEYKDILNMQVKPIFGSGKPKKLINSEKLKQAPLIGHFAILEKDDPFADLNPPYGVEIIRE
ncbi:hypothetical protein M2146_001165 [Lachnospiraceae bacterium PF1-22]